MQEILVHYNHLDLPSSGVTAFSPIDRAFFLIASFTHESFRTNTFNQSDWDQILEKLSSGYSESELTVIAKKITDNKSLNHLFIKNSIRGASYLSSLLTCLIKSYSNQENGEEFTSDLVRDEKTSLVTLGALVEVLTNFNPEQNSNLLLFLSSNAEKRVRQFYVDNEFSEVIKKVQASISFYSLQNENLNKTLDYLIKDSLKALPISDKLLALKELVLIAEENERLWEPISEVLFSLCFEVFSDDKNKDLFSSSCQIAVASQFREYFLDLISEFLERYGLENSCLIYDKRSDENTGYGEWFQTEGFKESVNLIYDHFSVISELEEKRPGACLFLNKYFGIRMFGRYSVEALAEQYDYSTEVSSSRNVTAMVTTVYDNSYESFTSCYSILAPYEESLKIEDRPVFLFYEFNSDLELIKTLLSISQYSQDDLVLQVNIHGSATGAILKPLNFISRGQILNNDILPRRFVENMSLKKLTLVLNCCEAGVKGFSLILNIGTALFSTELDFDLWGPSKASPMTLYRFKDSSSLALLFDEDTSLLRRRKDTGEYTMYTVLKD